MRPGMVIALGVTAVAFCGVFWRVPRSPSTSPLGEVAGSRPGAEVTASISHASDRPLAGMDRKAYDALARRTWELLKRGDAGQLVQQLARGDRLEDIRSDSLRSSVSAKLAQTDEDYSTKKLAESTNQEAAIRKKIDAGKYVLEKPWMDEPNAKSPDDDSRKELLVSAWRNLPDGSWIRVDLFEGEAPEFERARREFELIEARRVKELTQIFEARGLLLTGTPK